MVCTEKREGESVMADRMVWKRCGILFYKNVMISAFTFGGGYVVIPMMRGYFVDKRKWLSEEELMELAAVAQSMPGAIAVNLAVLVGYRAAGKRGAAISCIGSVLPPLILLSLVSLCYQAIRDNRLFSALLKGMEAGAAAVVVDLVGTMVQNLFRQKSFLSMAMMAVTFAAIFFFNIHAVFAIAACLAVELAAGFWRRSRNKGGEIR